MTKLDPPLGASASPVLGDPAHPLPSPWAHRWAWIGDEVQRLRHCRAAPFLAARTAFSRGGPEGRYRRWLRLREGDPAALAWLADAIAARDDWRAFEAFLDEHDRALRRRLSNVALARLSGHLRHFGWFGRAEVMLSHRLARFPHSPALGAAYALLGREARRQGDARTWDLVKAWHLARARGRPAIREALWAAGAARDGAAPVETRGVEAGEGHLCAFEHAMGRILVLEKVIARGSPEARVLRAFGKGRLGPPGGSVQVAMPLLVVEAAGQVSLFFRKVPAPALTRDEFVGRLEDLAEAMGRFNARTRGRAPAWMPRLSREVSLAQHPAAMADTLSQFPAPEAAALRADWEAVLGREAALLRAWRAVPHVVQHRDVHGGNLLATDPLTLIDWECAAVGPAGAELGTMLAMSGEVQFEEARTRRLISVYGRALREGGVRLSDGQLDLGVWVPYLARHAVLPNPHPHNLRLAAHAIRRGRALLGALLGALVPGVGLAVVLMDAAVLLAPGSSGMHPGAGWGHWGLGGGQGGRLA